MKYNFKKILSAITTAAMISSTVGLAAAANYPAPFVANGAADVAIVYGGSPLTAATDLAAVTDITADLQTKLAAQTTVNGTASTAGTVTGGDYVKLSRDSTKLSLLAAQDTLTEAFGSTSVTKDNLKTLLADGTYSNDVNNEYKYEQYVTIGALQLTNFQDSDYQNRKPTVGLKVASNTFVMNYTLDFITDAASTGGGSTDYTEFETTDLPFLGKKYYISDAKNLSGGIKLTLLDSANSATVSEGDTKEVTVGGKAYTVTMDASSLKSCSGTTKVKLIVNGASTNSLAAGESYKLADGTYVGIKDIACRDVAGTVGNVEFSLGTGQLVLDGSNNQVKLNDKSIDGLTAYVNRGSASGGKDTIDKIVITWKTSDKAFVTPTTSLTMPGFGAIKLSMDAFIVPSTEVVQVDRGDRYASLTLPLKDGVASSVKFLGANASGEFNRIGGDSSDEVLYTAPAVGTSGINYSATTSGGYFFASYNSSKDTETYWLSATVSTNDDGYNRTTIKNKVTGSDVCSGKKTGDSCTIGNVALTITSVTSDVSGNKLVNITAGSDTYFDRVYTKNGMTIFLPYTVGATNVSVEKGAINLTTGSASTYPGLAGHNVDSFYLFMETKDKDGTVGVGGKLNATIDDTSDKVTVSAADGTGLSATLYSSLPGESSDNQEGRLASSLATEIHRVVSDSKGRLEITVPSGESYANVYLSAPSASITGGSTTLGSVSVKDSEAASVSTKNLIVVGGSCINTVAASLLGSSTPICSADFTAKTGVEAGGFLIQTFAQTGGKVATLVAGYNAGDTTNAATALKTQTVDTTAGKKYTGTSATTITSVVA